MHNLEGLILWSLVELVFAGTVFFPLYRYRKGWGAEGIMDSLDPWYLRLTFVTPGKATPNLRANLLRRALLNLMIALFWSFVGFLLFQDQIERLVSSLFIW